MNKSVAILAFANIFVSAIIYIGAPSTAGLTTVLGFCTALCMTGVIENLRKELGYE